MAVSPSNVRKLRRMLDTGCQSERGFYLKNRLMTCCMGVNESRYEELPRLQRINLGVYEPLLCQRILEQVFWHMFYNPVDIS